MSGALGKGRGEGSPREEKLQRSMAWPVWCGGGALSRQGFGEWEGSHSALGATVSFRSPEKASLSPHHFLSGRDRSDLGVGRGLRAQSACCLSASAQRGPWAPLGVTGRTQTLDGPP